MIPDGMSVTEAAKQLGVGRPALSNLLNGRASLSAQMALRLEEVFGADRQSLLDRQADADHGRRRQRTRTVAVHAYAPSFLTEAITARRISEWATGSIEARHQLPELLRRLVNTTGRDLRSVDFPGGDNAQRPGWDGWVKTEAATPWIPEGNSGWEFSTAQRPGSKADHDYAIRLATVSAKDRAACTFVFVTTRNWPAKNHWARNKAELDQWKAVRALDASDLEQWLEASVSGQVWLAGRLGIPTDGVETLGQSWARWTSATDPRLPAKIFAPSLNEENCSEFRNWLTRSSKRPFAVAGDSKDEALAFLFCLFQESGVPAQLIDQATVFTSTETLTALASSSASFIPIACDEDTERELTAVYRQRHCIVVRPRNVADQRPDIALEVLSRQSFDETLATMGIERDDFDRLGRESGRSPTVLRRRLSTIPAIRTPQWAEDRTIARRLIPFVMVGAWHTESEADRGILAKISATSYSQVEVAVTDLLDIEDAPVWSVGQYRGVVSKLDALFAIARLLTADTIEDFLALAEYVLSESDPSLALNEDQRWDPGLYGKVRRHSATLRTGICETLVLLSVHGNDLVQVRLGIDVEGRVASLIKRLLLPLTLERLLSQEEDLPRYAEAAPNDFLALVEEDLRKPKPVLQEILKPADTSSFLGCPRAGLLWALECLAWNPQNLARVTEVLADLAKTNIEDNWSNKPIASLESIYRCWLPQTAASLDDRISGLTMLARRFPNTGWHICMEQFESGKRTGNFSYRPRWRADASGAGQVVSRQESYKFARIALDLALTGSWEYDSNRLGDLIERLEVMPDEDKTRVWNLVDTWARVHSDEGTKAELRERIRRYALGLRRRNLATETLAMARSAYAKLEPLDLVIRHSWLFESEWIDVPADEWISESVTDADGRFDFDKRDDWVQRRRTIAMAEIWARRGFAGISSLVARSDAAHIIGRFAALTATGLDAASVVLQGCLSTDLSANSDTRVRFNAFMQGFIWYAVEREGYQLLTHVSETSNEDKKVRLFTCAPFNSQTWRLLDVETHEIRERYWRDVHPHRNRLTEVEINESLDRLLDAKRPWAAFRAVEWEWKKIETSRLKRLLMMVATSSHEDGYAPRPDGFDISHALKSLSVRADVATADMVQLELAFIDVLDDDDEYGVPNLERQIAESPMLFVQALALCYNRSDGGDDPQDWVIQDPEQHSAAARAAYRILDGVRSIPGSDADRKKINVEELRTWVTEVRRLCTEHGRLDVGDQRIGQLLARAPRGDDGQWPCEPVCEVMQTVHSEHLARGFHLGVYNARGMHERGDGGDQERELATRYRNLARRLAYEYPFVSRILEDIANTYNREATDEDSAASVRRRLIL